MSAQAGKKSSGTADVISVIDEFDYSTQGKSYSDAFREWRRRKGNPFSFSYEKRLKESVYVDGRGFIISSAGTAEREVLIRIFYIIGMASLMWVVTDTILTKLAVMALSMLGFDVHTNFFSSMIYGGGLEMICVLISSALLRILIPAVYLHYRFRLPAKVELMNSMHDSRGLVGAIGMTLIVSTLTNLPSAYSSEAKELYTFFKTLNTDVSVWNQTEFVVYAVFDVVVVSALSEIFFRGAMFAVLRQFGDRFAVIMTTVTAALLVQDLEEVPAVAMMSLVASFGMLKSGSIFTAVVVSIVFKTYQLALAVIEVDPSEEMFLTRNLFMAIMLLAGALMLVFSWLLVKLRTRSTLAEVYSELTMKERIIHSVKVFPYSAVAAICLVYTLVRAVL